MAQPLRHIETSPTLPRSADAVVIGGGGARQSGRSLDVAQRLGHG